MARPTSPDPTADAGDAPEPGSRDASLRDGSLREALRDFIASRSGAAVTVSALRRYPVGFSWITYGFEAVVGGETLGLILRLGPENGLFAPYSARPQFEVLQALRGGAVPVPRAFWSSDDPSILGHPFFICEKVGGEAPIPWVSGAGDAFSDEYRVPLGEQFVDALAAIHAFDWRASALACWDDGRTRATTAAREVEHWAGLHRRLASRPYPMLNLALLWLRANQPVAPRLSIVHGDYRLGNFLEIDGTISAILDWELVHLGDPHEDIGWACLPQYMAGSGLVCRLIARETFFTRYERATGMAVDPASVRFHTVFSLLKLAVTHMAAVRCFEEGRGDDIRMAAMGTQIVPTLRQIEKLLDEAP